MGKSSFSNTLPTVVEINCEVFFLPLVSPASATRDLFASFAPSSQTKASILSFIFVCNFIILSLKAVITSSGFEKILPSSSTSIFSLVRYEQPKIISCVGLTIGRPSAGEKILFIESINILVSIWDSKDRGTCAAI